MKQKLVVIGNGMAGMRAVEELLALAPKKYDVTVFGEEPLGNYNRIMLSPVLAGEKTVQDIMINDDAWYADNNVALFKSCKVTTVDRKKKQVHGADGTQVPYDKIILATGSLPFMLPLPGADLEGVIAFRDVKDVDTMLKTAKAYENAVVIGGGLLGLEAANGLMKNGMKVSVIHLMETLMERQMDAQSGAMLKASLEKSGMRFHMGAMTEAIEGEDRVTQVRLKDGTVIPADIVVMAVGIRPNTFLGKEIGLDVERGILVNDAMQTSDPDIYSVGECVQHRGATYGLVAPLYEQAKVLAKRLADDASDDAYEGSVTSTKLKVTGIDLFSAGDFLGNEASEDIVYHDASAGVYKKIVLQDNKVLGAVMYGDTADGAWFFRLLREGTDVSEMRDSLIFGEAFATGAAGASPADLVAAMSDDAEVCGCNGVCKGTVVTAITEKGLTTLDEVKSHTKASSSCGSCVGLVEQILAATMGGDYDATPKIKTVCKCTMHSHDTVREAIVSQELKSIPAVYEALDWLTPNGCGSCRPAINYYLLCAWPGEYVDDQQSRFINERAHANIQKDGTYSVVPRMWGGVTTPQELRAIADVADKYHIPTVKVTGGQRIDLLGVKKEDLPGVWADLNAAGMVSGHAYGKSLRTVKTCVGSEWCRFGTQDSTKMGIDLERMTWGSWTPHKFKMAVSGCPRNCAEATIKDLGVVAVDSGWEISVGGNGGIHVRATDFLVKVETEEDVKEYTGAFMQLYREHAHYLERTAPWIERVGLDFVKERIVDDPVNRKTLFERFLYSQSFMQDDPWANRHGHSEFAASKSLPNQSPVQLEAV